MFRSKWRLVSELRERRGGVMLCEGVCLVCCGSDECEIVYTEGIRSLLRNHQVVRYN